MSTETSLLVAAKNGNHNQGGTMTTTPETATHNERCCMEGAWPGWGPHPDCPGVEALNEVRRQDAVTAVTPMTPGMVCGPVDHDWQPDPGRVEAVHAGRKDEGLTCTLCGMTEAELDAMERGPRATWEDDLPF